MTNLSLLAVSLIMNVVMVLFVLCSVILVLVILIQKGKGGGLSGAFGGGMASGLLGTKTGDFLTWFTIALVGLFLFLAVIMAKFYRPSVSDIGITSPQVPPAAMPTEQPGRLSQPAVTEIPTVTETTSEVNLAVE